MKKFLSLVLALVMTMSLVTISAGAATFADDASITYDEAVEVIAALGVVNGYDDGSFAPKGNLTRGAASKIICNMILGPTTAAELSADAAPFKDVPANHVFAGYIAYCVKEGIINGYTDGTFRPAEPLTGYAFMKMLLGALGYNPVNEGYTGDNWSINVAKRALGIGLNKGLLEDFNGTKAVTREEAALYAFNTLKATMVEYDQETTVNFGNGQNITVSGPAQDLAWGTGTLNDGKVAKDGFVQFAERYFSKLTGTPTTDAFGRPATAWTYNKKDIGTFVRKDLLASVDTVAVKGGEIYATIGSVAAKYALSYYVDGVAQPKATVENVAKTLVKGDKTALAASGNGVVTEVYVDADTEETTIVVINTYLAEVTSDYSAKNENIRVSVFTGVDAKDLKDIKTTTLARTVKLANVANCADYEEGDMALVTMADGVVMSMADPEVVADVAISSYSTNDGKDTESGTKMTKLTADGTKYEADKNANWKAYLLSNYDPEQLDDNTFNLYLDPYGYVIGLEEVGETAEYIFVTSYDDVDSPLSKVNDKATIITIEGEMLTVEVKQNDLLKADTKVVNAWYEYEMDGDVYVLEAKAAQVKDTTTKVINSSNTTLAEDIGTSMLVKFGNASSTYITVSEDSTLDKWITSVDTVETGIKNVNIAVTDTAYALYKNGYVTYAVVIGEDNSSSNNLAYITSNAVVDKTYVDKTTGYVYTYNCIINGEETTVQIKKGEDTADKIKGHTLYKLTYDANGYAKAVELKKDASDSTLDTTVLKNQGWFVTNDYANWVVTAQGATLYLDDDLENKRYAILDDEANYFVYNKEGEAKYVEFDTIDAALNETGKENKVDGYITIIADKTTGYATTVIIYDEKFEADEEIENTPAEDPDAPAYAKYLKGMEIDVENGKFTIDLGQVKMSDAAFLNNMTNEDIGDILTGYGYTNVKCTNDKWSFDKGYESYTGLDDAIKVALVAG